MLGWLIAHAWRVPHVVDFRDPWADAHFLPRRAKLAWRLERGLEKRILVHSSAAVVTQDEWRPEIYALVPPDILPVETIMNGFDEAAQISRLNAVVKEHPRVYHHKLSI